MWLTIAIKGPKDNANTDITITPRLMSLVREKLVHITLPSVMSNINKLILIKLGIKRPYLFDVIQSTH